MPGVVVSLIGVLLVLAALGDAVSTTLRLGGGGRLTNAVSHTVWRIARARSARDGRAPSSAGATALLVTIGCWVALLWLGWLLVFLPHQGAVVTSSDGSPADTWSRLYFVGYSVITLGVGDYAPAGWPFQVATVIAAVSGFFLVTLSVTYLVPVISAVVEARQLAARVLLVGATPAELVVGEAGADPGSELTRLATSLVAPIVLLSQRHHAYPVLRYFPSSRRETSTALAIAVLDEALTMALYGIASLDPDRRGTLTTLHSAIGYLLRNEAVGGGTAPPPDPPTLDALREAGVTTVDGAEFGSRAADLDGRRAALRALIEHEGRSWTEVQDPSASGARRA